MSKKQLEHLKSTLQKIGDLNDEISRRGLIDEEDKIKKEKIFLENRLSHITRRIDEIQSSLTDSEERITKNKQSIDEYRNKIDNELEPDIDILEYEIKAQEKAMYGKFRVNEGIFYTLGITILVIIGFLIGADVAVTKYPQFVAEGEELANSEILPFWGTVCGTPLLFSLVFVAITHYIQRWRDKNSNYVELLRESYNSHEKLEQLIGERSHLHNEIVHLRMANSDLEGMEVKKFNLDMEMTTVNNSMDELNTKEKSILELKNKLTEEIDSLYDEIKHLIPHYDRL